VDDGRGELNKHAYRRVAWLGVALAVGAALWLTGWAHRSGSTGPARDAPGTRV
jgi:hypothetical protein